MSELKGNTNTTVEIGLEYLINLGDFNNIKVIAHLSDAVRPGEKPAEAFDRVYKQVEAEVQKRSKAIKAAAGLS